MLVDSVAQRRRRGTLVEVGGDRAQGLGSLAVWERLMQDAPFEPEDAAEIDIDLGAETGLESRLETHADAVRLWWDGVPLGRIASIPGAERLSAIHVRDEAVRRHASDLLPKIRMPRKWSAFSRPPHPVGIASQPARRFVKALVARFDLGHPEHIWGLQSYEGLRILVTDHGQPVADLSLPLHRGTAVLAARRPVPHRRSDGRDLQRAGPVNGLSR